MDDLGNFEWMSCSYVDSDEISRTIAVVLVLTPCFQISISVESDITELFIRVEARDLGLYSIRLETALYCSLLLSIGLQLGSTLTVLQSLL